MSGPPTTDPLAAHRDDGPLGAALARCHLGVPELPVLLVACGLLAVSPAAAVAVALLARAGRTLPRLGWPVPALLRAIEYGTVLVLAGGTAWSYALLATLAFHHYDIVYRVRLLGTPPPPWLGRVTGGWPLRCAVLVAAAVLGRVDAMVVALTVALAAVFLAEAATHWLRPAHRPHPEETT